MCGVTGFWRALACGYDDLIETATAMADTLVHRGPDAEGVWCDEAAGVAFGFRRLAILDLSPSGNQPMASESGRYVIVFNGEIYNFKDLRMDLQKRGRRFRGTSDTEVIVAAAEQWGVNQAVPLLNGMFAMAIWDREKKHLTLVRDRLGIKPLYYGWGRDTLLFGSELKAFRAHPGFIAEIDRSALMLYVRHGYVPGPYSIYKNVFKLQPGHLITFAAPSHRPVPDKFWSLKEVVEHGKKNLYHGTEEEALEELELLLSDAVKRQMVSDVPLGAFLSGGVDSSLIVALMQSHSSLPVHTFTIGFKEQGFDEAPIASKIAKHLGTDHTEMYVTSDEACEIIPILPDIYDEPFADSSSIPTCLLSRLTRRHVTVSLSGDGGDELFGGYPQYWTATRGWRHVSKVPVSCRSSVSRFVASLGSLLDASRIRAANPAAVSLLSHAPFFGARDAAEFIQLHLSRWQPQLLITNAVEPDYLLNQSADWPRVNSFEDRFMFVDTVGGLPHNMLTKVDRAASSASLEARVPLLDHRLAEFAWRLSPELKVRSWGQGKWALRSLLTRYVPKQLVDLPKKGFGIPIAKWLRGPLRDWGETLLSENRLREENYLDSRLVRKEWDRLMRGEHDWDARLWIVLMFQAWKERWLP